jgi:hypothetical protein
MEASLTATSSAHVERATVVAASGAVNFRRFAALLGTVLLAANLDVVLGTHSFFYRDFALFGYPNAHYLKQSLWRGEVPLWNPLSNCGVPFLAQWNTMALYPFSLFYVLLPLPWSLCLFNLAHLFLAGLGMYALARHWTQNEVAAGVAGAAFACNGLALHCLMWPNNMAALGWMPWVVLCAEPGWRKGGRTWLLATAMVAMQILTGAPEIILLTWVVIVGLLVGTLWQIHRERCRILWRVGAMALLAVSLTAIQLFPFFDLLAHSQRNRSFTSDVWAMPIWGWANLIVPLFHCSPSRLGVFSQAEQQWTSSYYLGIGTLALALIAVTHVRRPRARYLAAVACGGLALALGESGLILKWLKQLCPVIGLVRFPIKFIVLTVFALPLLAAFGLDTIQRPVVGSERRVRRSLVVTGLLLVLAIALLTWFAFRNPAPEEFSSITLRSGWTRMMFLVLTVAGAWWLSHGRNGTRWAGLLFVFLICLDGLTHAPRQNPTVPSQAFGPMQIPMDPLPKHGEGRAMISPSRLAFMESASSPDPAETVLGQRQAMFSNCNLVESIPKVDGFFSLYLKEESEVRSLLYRSTNVFHAGVADFLGVTHVSSSRNLFEWAPRTNALPLLTAGRRPVFASREETINGMMKPDFILSRWVYLPEETRDRISSSLTSYAAVVRSEIQAHRIEAEVEAAGPVLLVVAQAYYHPWQACVDGRGVPLFRANHAFQALEIPQGRHQVRLIYRDGMFRLGWVVTALSSLVWVVLWFRLRSRPSGPAQK